MTDAQRSAKTLCGDPVLPQIACVDAGGTALSSGSSGWIPAVIQTVTIEPESLKTVPKVHGSRATGGSAAVQDTTSGPSSGLLMESKQSS